jgi:hypothetical protein
VANLLVRMTAIGWRDDVDCGGDVAASDQPDWNGHAYKGMRRRASRAAHGARCPAASDRQAQADGMVSNK